MNINNNYSVSNLWNNLQKTQSSEQMVGNVASTSESSFDKIAQKYDMNNVSPREVDQLVDELRAAGMEWDFEHLGMLETRGARWLSRLAQIGEEQTGIKSTFDPDKKIDLVATIESNIAFNKQHGFDSEHYETLLQFVKKIDVGSVIPSKGLFA